MTLDNAFNSGPNESSELRPQQDYAPDIALIERYNFEFCTRFLPRVRYYSYDYSSTAVDELRGEYEEKALITSYLIPANFALIPKEKNLTAFGEVHYRDLEVHVSYTVLKHFNLNPKIGDLVYIHDAIYKVTEMDKEQFFAGTSNPLGLILYCVTKSLNEYPIELQQELYNGN